MLTSITPLGERGRNRNWATTVTAYIIGSVLGGAVTGLVVGGLGALVPAALRLDGVVIIVVLLAIVALGELGFIAFPAIPKRQVNEDWLDEYRGWVTGLGFGFQLGLGLVTIVTSLAVPVTFLVAFLTYSVRWGILIGVTFGLARALPILWTRRVTAPEQLATLHRRHDRSARSVAIAAALAMGPIAVLAVLV